MLKTNSKKVNEKIRELIINSYNSADEFYGYNGREMKTEYNDICKDILDTFYIEKCKNNTYYKKHLMSMQELFIEWCQGLPTGFNVADDVYLHSAVDFVGNVLEQTEAEKAKYTESEAEKLMMILFYRELTKHANK